jgi:hypothetical protein
MVLIINRKRVRAVAPVEVAILGAAIWVGVEKRGRRVWRWRGDEKRRIRGGLLDGDAHGGIGVECFVVFIEAGRRRSAVHWYIYIYIYIYIEREREREREKGNLRMERGGEVWRSLSFGGNETRLWENKVRGAAPFMEISVEIRNQYC